MKAVRDNVVRIQLVIFGGHAGKRGSELASIKVLAAEVVVLKPRALQAIEGRMREHS